MFHRILAPMHSGQSTPPPSRAIDLAEKYGAELHVLYVMTDGLVSRAQNREVSKSQQELDQLASADDKVNVHREVRQGSFSDTIQKYVGREKNRSCCLRSAGQRSLFGTSLSSDGKPATRRLGVSDAGHDGQPRRKSRRRSGGSD